MKNFIITSLGWIAMLLPAIICVYLLLPSHGCGVSILAALGVYFIIGVCMLVANALKSAKSQR